ncbi:MAG: hypothetical protein U9Q98_06900 [Bacteroidota bacterium]|nr:hypothetical protein [Bacteroidota bacterium]
MKNTTLLIWMLFWWIGIVSAGPVTILIKGGKVQPNGTVTYRTVSIQTYANGSLKKKTCRGRGPNTCPATTVVTVGDMNIDIEKDINPVIKKYLESGKTKGEEYINNDVYFKWKRAAIIGKDNLEYKLVIDYPEPSGPTKTIIRGGKRHDDGSVTYRKVQLSTYPDGKLKEKICTGKGPNKCIDINDVIPY